MPAIAGAKTSALSQGEAVGTANISTMLIAHNTSQSQSFRIVPIAGR